jgi:hypothetical protein
MWGLRVRVRGVEQLWQSVVGELEKIVMPQLGDVSLGLGESGGDEMGTIQCT